MKQTEIITFKASEHFKTHLASQAEKRKMKPGTYIKAVLKKYSGYKEPKSSEPNI